MSNTTQPQRPPSYDVVVVGSLNLDLVATTSRLPGPGETVLGSAFAEHAGGKGLNQAVAAARAGARVSFIGAVGDDEAGHRLRTVATTEGIDVSALTTSPGTATGRAMITVDDQAENSIVVIPGANARVGLDHAVPDLPPTRVALAQLEIPVEAVTLALRRARAAGARTVLNPAPARDLPDDLVESCDIVVPNEHELDLVGGIRSLHERGVTAVVVTRGAAGVTVSESVDGTVSTWSVDAVPVTPVDTTGAGDAFCGALAARLAAGDDLRAAVGFAAAAGALATTNQGAVPSLPYVDQIDALLATR